MIWQGDRAQTNYRRSETLPDRRDLPEQALGEAEVTTPGPRPLLLPHTLQESRTARRFLQRPADGGTPSRSMAATVRLRSCAVSPSSYVPLTRVHLSVLILAPPPARRVSPLGFRDGGDARQGNSWSRRCQGHERESNHDRFIYSACRIPMIRSMTDMTVWSLRRPAR